MKNWGLIFWYFWALLAVTLLTQIGAATYLIDLIVFKRFNLKPWHSRLLAHSAIYLSVTLLAIPQITPLFGREPMITYARIRR